MLFDAHTHLGNIDKPYKKIVCASGTDEWNELSFRADEKTIPAFGIHPWFIENADLSGLENIIQNKNCLLGECGLDKLKPSFEVQQDVFIAQLDLARKYNKIVVIHCVKAWNEMIEILKNYNDLSFLFHRFMGTKEIVKHLPEKSYFSLGLKNIEKYLPVVPSDRLLLETDDENYSIKELYDIAGIGEDDIFNNAKMLLGDLL